MRVKTIQTHFTCVPIPWVSIVVGLISTIAKDRLQLVSLNCKSIFTMHKWQTKHLPNK